MKKRDLVLIVLSVLLVATIIYIVVGEISENCQEARQESFNAGFDTGYQQAIMQLIQLSEDCDVVPLFAENVTYGFVRTDCLQIS